MKWKIWESLQQMITVFFFWKINVGREEDSTKVIRFDYNKMDLN